MTGSAFTASRAVHAGVARICDLTQASVDAIQRDDPTLEAMASFEPELALRDAARVEAGGVGGPLAGATLGVKDIYDTSDHPTEFYSPIYRGRRTAADAWMVDRLRRAGAVVMGKTHTAELAYSHTGPTRNPHDLLRTPGSSSAGSAAGVAAGLFDIAIGTQTAGSTIKPAAYCGIFAMKPTFGSTPLPGVKLLAPSFDTAGWFARDVRDLRLIAEVVMPAFSPMHAPGRPLRLLSVQTGWSIDADVAATLQTALHTLRLAGVHIDVVRLPAEFDQRAADHAIVNDAEGARSLAQEALLHRPALSLEMRALLDRAAGISASDEALARLRLSDARTTTLKLLAGYDAIVQPSCGCIAPVGLATTGPSDFIKVWSGMGLPQINIPLLTGPGAAPVGLQLVGLPCGDDALLDAAAAVAAILVGPQPLEAVLSRARPSN